MSTLQTGVHYPISIKALPTSWEAGYVGDFALEIQPGFASGKHNKEGRGIPHLRPFNINRLGKLDLATIKYVARDSDAKRLHSGDVLFNNTNSPELIGKTSVVAAAGEWGFSNHMTRIVFSDDVSPRFAAYQLHYLWMSGYFLYNCVRHVNQASVSSKTLARSVPFVKPPRPQQDRIVAEIEKQFSRLDKAVANLKRVKANLKRYKATVLKAAVEGSLVVPESVLARRVNRPYETGADFLEHVVTEREDAFSKRGRKYREPDIPSGTLPPLPPGWCWASWDQISVWVTYGFTRPMPHVKDGIPIVTARHVLNGRIDVSSTEKTTLSAFKELSEKDKPARGDILITKDGTIGRSAVVESSDPFCINQSVAVVWLCSNRLDRRFLRLVIESPTTQRHVSAKARGVAIQHLSITDFARMPVPFPPRVEQERIVAEVERRLSVIEELEAAVEANVKRADRLRQTTLSHAFSGRLLLAPKMYEPVDQNTLAVAHE